jgi:acetyl-CoA C-acetyltransferase
MKDVVIVEAARTPIGRYMGILSPLSAVQLGTISIKGVLDRSKIDPSLIEMVIMGNVVQAGLGQNPARQCAIHAGIPVEAGAMTLNMVCASGLQAANIAFRSILAGEYRCAMIGGMESMSNVPYIVRGCREGLKMGDRKFEDIMVSDGLWDIYNDFHMGITAEMVAEKYKFSRESIDTYAVNSHRKAIEATKNGSFKNEIIPVQIPQKKGDPIVVEIDEGPREDSTVEKLGKLKAVFKKDGVVTAGNAPGTNDGGAAVLIMDADLAKEHKLKPIAKIIAARVGGIAPEWVMLSPVPTIKHLIQKDGIKLEDIELIELNEAFAVQAMSVIKELDLNPDICNVNGGAVALGHPIGCSGARILVTLIHALMNRGKTRGLAALCLGGGNGVGMVVDIIK